MILKLQIKVWRLIAKEHNDEEMLDAMEWGDKDSTREVEIHKLTEGELNTLEDYCEKHKTEPGCETAGKRIAAYRNILANPGGKNIRRLEDLAQALRLYLTKSVNHWLFVEKDQRLLPWFIRKIEYHPFEKDCPAHVDMSLKAIQRGKEINKCMTWHGEDIAEGLNVGDLLRRRASAISTEEQVVDYRKSMEQYKKFQPQTGEQFIATGEGRDMSDRYSHNSTSLIRDGVPLKLVMDDLSDDGPEYGDDDGMEADVYWFKGEKDEAARVALPVHPYVKLFDLDNHCFIEVNTDQLEEYKWTPSLGDKLILPADHKDVITVLMETAADDIDDIIKGKSGGTIVICTGPPGTGKTLTAEVTSEVIQRPLYKVNCSQLGTNEEEIEKTLNLVLNRAARWKALLLIDEADVYVRERGADIQQNAIVGVFLRVLEYYRGVLFLTSNLATIIDDAIMSRATVHLKYVKPTPSELREIWVTLSVQFGQKFTDKFIDQLCEEFPGIVGRDVKNLLKLAIRHARHRDQAIDLKTFKLLAIHKDIKPKSQT